MDREISKEERRKEARKKILVAAGVVVAVIGVLVWLTNGLLKSVDEKDITLAVADRGNIETTVSAMGRVVPAFEQTINSPIATKIVEVYRREGDTLQAGTPLLRLDLQTTEMELSKLADERRVKTNSVEQASLNDELTLKNLEMQIQVKQMSVNRLKAEMDKEKRLDSLGTGTGDRVNEAELAYKTGKLELEQLRQQLSSQRRVNQAASQSRNLELGILDKNLAEMGRTLDDAKIKSPRQATLTFVLNEVGRQVGAGEKVAVISDLSHFKIDGQVADSYADRIGVGAPAIVKLGRTELRGHVSSLTPISKNGMIDFTVTVEEDNHPRLRSGAKAEVYITDDMREDVVRLPNGPYYVGAGFVDLFVLEPDWKTLKRRRIKVGESNYQSVEILSGLLPGEKAVISDMSSYKNTNELTLKKDKKDK